MARSLHNYVIYRLHDRKLEEISAKYFRGRLVDIGCGAKPYADMLKRFTSEHVGVDHDESPHGKSRIDRIGTAYQIPVPSETFDCALCTAVLEHLEEPMAALRECFRVL